MKVAAKRGSVCREKRLTKRGLRADITGEFALLRLRVSDYLLLIGQVAAASEAFHFPVNKIVINSRFRCAFSAFSRAVNFRFFFAIDFSECEFSSLRHALCHHRL